jgi:putative acyl-CoA dehydrogenase
LTHEVTNQPPALVGYDVYAGDAALVEAVHREGAGWADDELGGLGRLAGSEQAQEWGAEANRQAPVLHTHDRHGRRRDEVFDRHAQRGSLGEQDPSSHQTIHH